MFGMMVVTFWDPPEDERANNAWKVVCLGPDRLLMSLSSSVCFRALKWAPFTATMPLENAEAQASIFGASHP